MNSSATTTEWDERPSAPEPFLTHSDTVFETLFQQSADAIWLYEPETALLLDCNQAAVELIGAKNKCQLLQTRPDEISPSFQPDGTRTADKAAEIIEIVKREKRHHFEWVIRRFDGTEIPVEVSSTAIVMDGKSIHVVMSRDISERKKAERELIELTRALERRVSERTAELSTSEARFRALVEHAPEAIVVLDGETGHFHFGNEHACRLYGVPMERLTELTPADVSPEFQPDGRRSSERARELMDEALAGGTPVVEWIHQQPNGRLIPTEVRLLRLPAEGYNLIRASIIDNTERKRAECALRESEEKFRALFEASSQGVVLHDEDRIIEVNPAAVRILGRHSAQEMIGKPPREMAPPLQPNGESSEAMGRRYTAECLTKGSARFEWMASDPYGKEIPLEVTLTRIQWSGRHIIQAFVTDITERHRAQAALAESEARFSAAFQASPLFIGILRLSDGRYVLANDAFINWLGYSREEVIGHTSADFQMWESTEQRDACFKAMSEHGSIRQKECRWCNRRREPVTILLSAEKIQLNNTPHILSFALDISERKQAEAELRASEAQLRESEARFSVAFQASPVFTSVLRLSDEKFVLANDAMINWLGRPREEVLGRTSIDLGMWENLAERSAVLQEIRRSGSIRQRECHWRNRAGERFTILLSAETIMLDNAPHLLCLDLDITQRKKAEVEILRALDREKELSRLKSSFVSMVSHEFRTPLSIIQSSAELLDAFYDKMAATDREEQLQSIVRNSNRMAAMMEEMLVLSRLDAGKLEFQPTTLDLHAFCNRVIEEVLAASNARCHIELSLNSVPTAGCADERLLGHIFTNLLSNAVKYSEPDASIQFTVEQNGTDAVCVIRDHGIGIPDEDQERLFKAFHRGSNVGTRPGTGLGLLLVKRCAELHGGSVQVQSKIGDGTTVTVKVPIFRTPPL